jgi:hypothetical protein
MSSRRLVLGGLLAATWCVAARGDGGTLRLRERSGPYEVSVFTAPTWLRAGPVDISVLVQDAATGEPVPGASVLVSLSPRGRSSALFRRPATAEAATNKLLRAAVFDLPEPGWWDVEVAVDEGHGGRVSRVGFALEVDPAAVRLPALWLWIGWPALAVAIYGLHEYLAGRGPRSPGPRRNPGQPPGGGSRNSRASQSRPARRRSA